jgi:Fanconi anemia group J protein
LNQKCSSLLESPTGTGKSVALLCASLSWQKQFKENLIKNEKDKVINQMEGKTTTKNKKNELRKQSAAFFSFH